MPHESEQMSQEMSQEMSHGMDQEMGMEYYSPLFKSRVALVESIENSTLLPRSSLNAGSLLNEAQMETLRNIRCRRLSPALLERFMPD